MRIAKSTFVDPDQNTWYGALAVAVSFFVFAYSSQFGQLPILVFYALWLPLVLVDYRRVLGSYSRYYWILGFAVLACLSVFWSRASGVTARASVQYLTHVMCALIAARTMSARTLSLGALVGTGLVLLYSFAFGHYRLDPLDQTYGFVGVFASKNQLGFFASLGTVFAYAALAILPERWPVRILAASVGALSLYALFICHSATSVISTLATLATLFGVSVLLRFSPGNRKPLLFLVAMAIPLVVIVALSVGAIDAVLGVFGKSTTLTGRTYLWQQGLEAAKAAPLLGIGYQAYWVIGFSDAERLWAEFFIGSRMGFHFHNTYIEALVELGLAGMLLLIVVMAVTIGGHLRRLLVERSDVTSQLMFGLGVLLLIRSFVEIDVMHPYHVGSFLLYYAAGLIAMRQPASRPARRQFRPAIRRPIMAAQQGAQAFGRVRPR